MKYIMSYRGLVDYRRKEQRRRPGTLAMRGGRRGGLWSEEEIASSGTGSERAQVRERSRGDPSASQRPRDPAHAAGEEEFLGTSPFFGNWFRFMHGKVSGSR